MKRASVDITGPGPHTIVDPGPSNKVMMRNLFLTFSHASETSLRVWFYAGTNVVAGPYYVSDGGQIRYKSSESSNIYIGGTGEPFDIKMDPDLSAAGTVDYEIGAW